MSRRAFFLWAALVVGLLAVAAAAGAAETHPFLTETNGAPTAGSRPPTGAFEDACGIALDSHGDRYVADYYHDAVDVFGSSGEYLTQIAKESNGNGPCGLAVDASGHLYVENWRAQVVRYTPSAYPPTANTTFGEPTLIDNSGTATGVAVDVATGDLYVDDTTYIAHFEAPVGAGQTPARIGEGQIGEGYGLARSSFAATAGDLYVPDATTGTVKVFGAAGESLPAIDGAGTPQGGFDFLVDSAVAVNFSDGHVFVADNLEHGLSEHPAMAIEEFNPAGGYRGQISRWITHPPSEPGVVVEHTLQTAEPSGLAVDPSGDVYVTSGNSDNSESSQLDRDGKPVEGSLLYTFGPTSPARTLTVTKSGSGAGTVTSNPAGIACGSACVAEYDEGTKVTLAAAADAHSVFLGWSGACSGSASSCQVTMSAARSVGAEFEALPQQTLEIGIAGAGTGSVTSSPAGIVCASGICSEHFNEGSTVLLTESPAPHNRFIGWGGPDCDESTQTTCEVVMSQAKAVSAGFAPILQQALEVTVSGEGSVTSTPSGISCPGSCGGHFDSEGPASTVVLTAHPAALRQVAWSGCSGEPGPDECEVTMSEAHAVTAQFIPILGAPAAPVVAGAVLGGNSAASLPPSSLARITLGKLTVRGARATLRVGVSGPGLLTASAGVYVRRVSLRAKNAGELALPLVLSRGGRRALARYRRLAVPVRLAFSPAGGGSASTASTTVTFKAAHSKRRHHGRH
jgi:hypothetical protein